MKQKTVLLALFAVVVTVAALAAPVAAQENAGNATAAPASDASETETERIDNSTTLIETSYDTAEGTATITIKSERSQLVTLTDAGGLFADGGGEIATRQVVMSAGETATIRLPATRVDGVAGVSIITRETRYGTIVWRAAAPDLTPPTNQWWLALPIGIFGALGTGELVYRVRRWLNDDGVVEVGAT